MKWKALLLLLSLQIPCFAAWYSNGWAYRAEVRVLHSKVDADLSNFPTYINLADFGSGHGIWSHVLSTGADLRITSSDGTTEIPIEVVVIDTSAKTGEVHFKASSLANSSNSSFYLYYGNGDASAYAASATYGRQNVWDSNYKGVYHLSEVPTGTLTDSTAQGNNLTSEGSMTSGDLITGKLGKAIDFDGNDRLLSNNNTGISGGGNRTMSVWVNQQSGNADADTVVHIGTTTANLGYGIVRGVAGGGKWSIWTHTGPSDVVGTHDSNTDIGTFKYLLATYTPTTDTLYYEGASDASNVLGVLNTTASKIYIGGSAGGHYLISYIDEVRLSNVVRATTWISTEYNNQSSSSTFYTIGSEENAPVASSNAIMFGTWF